MAILDVQIFGNSVPIRPGSVNISFSLGQIGTLSLLVISEFASLIQVGQLVEVLEAKDDQSPFVRVFSGQVSRVIHTHDYAGSNAWLAQVEARDANAIAARRPTDAFPTGEVWPQADDPPGGLTIDRIVKRVAEHYLQDDQIFFDQYVAVGPRISSYAIDIDQYVSEIYDELARLASSLGTNNERWYWFIDADRQLHFFPMGYESSPVSIGDGQTLDIMGAVGEFGNFSVMSFEETDDQLANVIILRLGHYVLDPVTEYFTGNGLDQTWNLSKPCNSLPACKVQQVGSSHADVKTVGVAGLDNPQAGGAGADFYFNAGSPTISADAPLGAGDILEVTYQGQDTRKIRKVDQASIQERINVAGGAGIYGRIFDLNDPATSSDIDQLAQSWLDKLKEISRIIRVRVWDEELLVQQLRIGQLCYVDPNGFGVLQVTGSQPAGFYLIRSITMQDHPEADANDAVLWREIELVQGPILQDGLEYLQEMVKQGAPIARKTSQPIREKVAQAKFDAPAPGDETDWAEPVPMSGAPVLASANIVTPGTVDDYKIDFQYNDLDPDDSGFAAGWTSIFPTVNNVHQVIVIPAGSHKSAQVLEFEPGVEFTKGTTRLKAVIEDGPSDGAFLSAHLEWR